MSQFFGKELGLRGNEDDYYNARNSLLPCVMDSRLGIPISLSLLYMIVGRRADLRVEGINLPGHFVVRHGGILLDPFHEGRLLTAKRLRTDFIFSKSNIAARPPSGGSSQIDLDPHAGKPFVRLPTGTERTGAKDDYAMDSPSGPKMSSAARVEMLNTGTELLFGSVLNTHLSFLAQQLFPIGLRVQRQSTIPDGESIRDAITESASRSDVILVTGGLGPTTDDITREIVSELTDRPLAV